MAFKAALSFFAATAFFVQAVYSQQCGSSNGYSSQVISPISLGSLGYGSGASSGCGGNLGYSNINLGSSNQGSFYPQGIEALAIATASTYGPSSISVNSDNLEIGGHLIVTGQMPVYGTVSVSGDVPTGGQAQVQYSTAPGVGLTSGGCGYGLASSVPSVGYSNSGLVGGLVGNSGQGQLMVSNGLSLNNGLVGLSGVSQGCGCGY